jgi:hypothetical protein
MKTNICFLLFAPACLIFASCGNESSENNQLKDGDIIWYPDTVAFKEAWQMEEKQMRDDLFAADTMYNQLGLDTFELTYRMCLECPDWIDFSKLELDCKECSDFYIEPADPSLKIPEELFIYEWVNTVRFYGVRVPEMGIPSSKKFSYLHATPWTIVKYYGYEVIRPYKIWAPRPKIFDEIEDTVEVPLTVTIQ